ncbi:MAG: glycosyltransferase [Patescibacteria group bacterium]
MAHNPPKTKYYRFLEMIPGTLIWATFIGAIVLSFFKPIWAIYFIIAFDLYWVFRVSYFIFYVALAWRRYKKDVNHDWVADIKKINDWERIYHLVFLPTYNEPYEVLDTTFKNLTQSTYPLDKMIVVLAGEERAKEHFEKVSRQVKEKYGHKFFKFVITLHPDNVEGEMKAKGANAAYAGREVKKLIDNEWKIPYQDIIVSYFDCDTVVHPKYFACLAYKYLTSPNPTRTSYQPAVLYNNNIWDAPIITRVTAFGTIFWLMTDLLRPERLFTFSSHSMSWQALVDVDFWQSDIVTDDSRIFLQCFMRYDGDYSVTPIYVPVSMDAVLADNYWDNFKNLYKQQRRWGYGVEHFPYMVWNFKHKKDKITFGKRFKYLFNITEGMYSWVTAPILIFILGRLPLWWVQFGAESTNVLVQNAPFVLEKLMAVAMSGIFISAILSILLLPPRPKTHSPLKYLAMFLQWLLLPITLIVFGSIPAAEAQTRLMLGKYLGFFVTPKVRK